LVLGPTAGSSGTEGLHWGGAILFREGQAIEVEEFEYLFGDAAVENGLSVKIEGVSRSLALESIARISIVEAEWDRDFLRKGSVLEVELRNGRSAAAILARDYSRWIRVRFLDPFTGEIQTERYALNGYDNPVLGMTFGDDIGSMRWSASSDRYFPPSFNFDPYTGGKLTWKTPLGVDGEAPTEAGIWACPACRHVSDTGPGTCTNCGRASLAPARTNLLDHGVDYFLRRSGIDPASPEALAAKRLSYAWLNPFSTEEEIDNALRDVLEVIED
jgi:hypothetical protein